MRRILTAGACAALVAATALGFYEWTAKSPLILGARLPGWQACRAAERTTRWNQPTGWLVLDKTLHETEEALRFYGLLR